jgi:hypothetical protein
MISGKRDTKARVRSLARETKPVDSDFRIPRVSEMMYKYFLSSDVERFTHGSVRYSTAVVFIPLLSGTGNPAKNGFSGADWPFPSTFLS